MLFSKPLWQILLNRAHVAWSKFFGPYKYNIDRSCDPQQISDIIYEKLISVKPCMIGRFGSTELYCLTNYMSVKKGWRNFYNYILGRSEPFWWIPERIDNMKSNAGFFSNDIASVEKYCELMLNDIPYLDVLGSWINKEGQIEDYLHNAFLAFLPYLEPYWAERPWTRALKNKNVLIVHPFANQILMQYQIKDCLFKNHEILPDFNLKVLKSIQSMGGDDNGFKSWFEALEYMKCEMDAIDYDICIIGCGAYGFHLAAHAKRMGKKAIHLGGATQLLFGIKGNRWEDPMYGVKEWGLPYGFYANMFNEYWIKPGLEGRPKNADQVEGACYW